MKKNMVKVALVAVVGLIAGINVFNAKKYVMLSDIAMENVEALAQVRNSESTITGNCLANMFIDDECHVLCWVCGTEWYPEERQPQAKAWNVTGKCGVCHNDIWGAYND